MKKKNYKPEIPHSDEENVPSWIDDSNDRTTPYTDEELDLFTEGFKEGMSDTPAWKELVRRVGEKEALRIVRRGFMNMDPKRNFLTD